MDTVKKIMLLLLLVVSLNSCVVGYYGPAPYRYHHSQPSYRGWGYYHHPQYNSYHRGMRRYPGRPVHQHYGPR